MKVLFIILLVLFILALIVGIFILVTGSIWLDGLVKFFDEESGYIEDNKE